MVCAVHSSNNNTKCGCITFVSISFHAHHFVFTVAFPVIRLFITWFCSLHLMMECVLVCVCVCEHFCEWLLFNAKPFLNTLCVSLCVAICAFQRTDWARTWLWIRSPWTMCTLCVATLIRLFFDFALSSPLFGKHHLFEAPFELLLCYQFP